jgi:hypothetical protein
MGTDKRREGEKFERGGRFFRIAECEHRVPPPFARRQGTSSRGLSCAPWTRWDGNA